MKPLHKALATALLCTSSLMAQAVEFTVFIYEVPQELAKRTSVKDKDSYWGAFNQFAGALAQAGVLRGGTALTEAPSAAVRGPGGSSKAVAGARLGGYFVIDVADLEAAKKWALKAPASAVAVEVIAHQPNPTMADRAAAAPK